MPDKLTIIGAGIVGTTEAWYALEAAEKENRNLIVRVLDQYAKNNSTSINIVPSITILEMLAVIPPIDQFERLLKIAFNEGGIHPGLPGITDSEVAKRFIEAIRAFSANAEDLQARNKALLDLGVIAMELWQKFYDDADPELKDILEQSGFHPCRESNDSIMQLKKGYRIDLIEKATADQEADEIIAIHQKYGFQNSKKLTPAQVRELDPLLSEYCSQNALNDNEWKPGITAVWRPGGCINTRKFIPLFHQYMEKRFGTYSDSKGKSKNRFEVKYNKTVQGIELDNPKKPQAITGLIVNGEIKKDKDPDYGRKRYVFCPGEEVGLLSRFGFDEPAYAGFAGAVLIIELPIPDDQMELYKDRRHGMEVHQDGVVLAWQCWYENQNGKPVLMLGMGGTKSFYADAIPNLNDPFFKDRHLLQLNAANNKFPRSISMLLGRDTTGQVLGQKDLDILIEKGFAKPYAGRRANSATGMPCVGPVSYKGMVLNNARVNTYWSSGGVSYAHAAAKMNQNPDDPKYVDAMKYADPRLKPKAKL
ncbi:MAG: hypothetical protein WC748_01595 [Legionellales bacterium]